MCGDLHRNTHLHLCYSTSMEIEEPLKPIVGCFYATYLNCVCTLKEILETDFITMSSLSSDPILPNTHGDLAIRICHSQSAPEGPAALHHVYNSVWKNDIHNIHHWSWAVAAPLKARPFKLPLADPFWSVPDLVFMAAVKPTHYWSIIIDQCCF